MLVSLEADNNGLDLIIFMASGIRRGFWSFCMKSCEEYIILKQYYMSMGLVQERRKSSALALELCLSCTKLLMWSRANVAYATKQGYCEMYEIVAKEAI